MNGWRVNMQVRSGFVRQIGVAVALLAVTVSVGGEAHAAEPRFDWRVSNPFPLLANASTEERFGRDLDAYLACMRDLHEPLYCPSPTRPGVAATAYALRFRAKTLSYREALLWPSSGEPVKDRVSISAGIVDAPDGATCTWTINGEQRVDGPCEVTNLRVRLYDPETEDGRRQVNSVSIRMKAGATERTFTDEIKVRRIVVVALGDSFASGEGNPLVFSRSTPGEGEGLTREAWLEKRCHRSLLSAAGLTAWRLAASGKVMVSYVNVACSGATTWHVPKTARAYEGVENAQAARNEDASQHYTQPYLPAQIDEVKKAFCGTERPCRIRPDIVFLAVGINDLDFSGVVRRLVSPGVSGTPVDWRTAEIKARVDRLGEAATRSGTLLNVYTAIEKELAPRRAFVIEYPDPTKDDSGAYCNASPIFGGLGALVIDRQENRWADDTLLKPLNAAIGRAIETMRTSAPHWQMVTGSVGATRAHGYCAEKKFFNLGSEAKVNSGTLHPNVLGHDAIAALVLDAVKATGGVAP